MKITPIDNKFVTSKSTGYAAAVCICLTAISGASKNKAIYRTHKPLALITGIITAIHIGLIEYYNKKYKQNK